MKTILSIKKIIIFFKIKRYLTKQKCPNYLKKNILQSIKNKSTEKLCKNNINYLIFSDDLIVDFIVILSNYRIHYFDVDGLLENKKWTKIAIYINRNPYV